MPAMSAAELASAATPTPAFPRWTIWHPRTMTIGTIVAATLSIIAFYFYFFYYIFLIMNERSQGKLMSSTNRTHIMDQD